MLVLPKLNTSQDEIITRGSQHRAANASSVMPESEEETSNEQLTARSPWFTQLLSFSGQRKAHDPDEESNQSNSIDQARAIESTFSETERCEQSLSSRVHNVDNSMYGLHTCLETEEEEHIDLKLYKKTCFEHDWVLDGTDSDSSDSEAENKLNHLVTRPRRIFGDSALDNMLGMLEIENTSSGSNTGENSIPARKSNGIDKSECETEEVIDFADFSCSDSFDIACDNDIKLGLASGDVLVAKNNNLQNDVLFEYEQSHEYEGEEGSKSVKDPLTQDIASTPGYNLPQSTESLGVTNEKYMSTSYSVGFSSHYDNCAHFVDVPKECARKENKHKESLLMSSVLLDMLPMPDITSDDPIASLTRRIQNSYKTSKKEKVKMASAKYFRNELIESDLVDTIHSGYYQSTGDKCDSKYFNSIILDELLNVPWPFHKIDLSESFIDEDIDPDLDDREKYHHISFDSYISNRLSELDSAAVEIMNCILSRLDQKKEAIDREVKLIFAAELDISTALVFSRSSHELLHRAIKGYKLTDSYSASADQQNIISSLEILHNADNRSRLQCLLETIGRVTSIRELEIQWWKDVTVRIKTPRAFQELVNGTKRLKELVCGEEVLNQAFSLSTMRDRISRLSDALMVCVEASLADLFAQILCSAELCPTKFERYFHEYETLLQTWVSCCQLKADDDQYTTQLSKSSFIADGWSDRILKILCFEVSKSSAYSLIYSHCDEKNEDRGSFDDMKAELNQIKDDSCLEPVSQRLLVMRLGEGHHTRVLLSVFFQLCSRLVELLNLYCEFSFQ